MRRLAWFMVFVLVLVIWGQLEARNDDPETRAVRAALEDLPLTDREREQVTEAFRHRDDRSQEPIDVTDRVLAGARRYELPTGGRLTVRISWDEGAWYLYDRGMLAEWTGEPWLRSLEDTFDRAGHVGFAGGVTTVSWCQGGTAPLAIRRRDHPPDALRAGADAVTELDLDLPTGEAVIQGNGGGEAQAVIALPPGRYRARISLAQAADCARQWFALDLWPRRRATGLRTLTARG